MKREPQSREYRPNYRSLDVSWMSDPVRGTEGQGTSSQSGRRWEPVKTERVVERKGKVVVVPCPPWEGSRPGWEGSGQDGVTDREPHPFTVSSGTV